MTSFDGNVITLALLNLTNRLIDVLVQKGVLSPQEFNAIIAGAIKQVKDGNPAKAAEVEHFFRDDVRTEEVIGLALRADISCPSSVGAAQDAHGTATTPAPKYRPYFWPYAAPRRGRAVGRDSREVVHRRAKWLRQVDASQNCRGPRRA